MSTQPCFNRNISEILAWPRLPGRLKAEEASVILGFNSHDIPVLVAIGLLKPLGNPSPNAVKYFASQDIQALAGDTKWLHKATKATYDYWAGQNKKRRDKHGVEEKKTTLPQAA
jgi:hypothetical protein